MNVGELGAWWAKEIVNELINSGVTHFCLSPGFRSTSLALAVATNSRAKHFVHFDERGSGFHALGIAKATGNPVAIIVTSGTAVGNLYPAVMEASLSHVPLIILTADRPAELREVKANQACDQVKFFGSYVETYVDLPSPASHLPKNFLSKTIAHAVFRARYAPVHINCPFPEPYFGEKNLEKAPLIGCKYAEGVRVPSEKTLKMWASKLESAKNGVIVVGALSKPSQAVETLAQTLKWPILPDIISSHRELNLPSTARYYDSILKSQSDLRADLIFHIGEQCVSKVLLQWMAKHVDEPLLQASAFPERCDPQHLVTDRYIGDPIALCEALIPHLTERKTGWISQWQQQATSIEETLNQFLQEKGFLNEVGLVSLFEPFLHSKTALFLANSMPIRDSDRFLFPKRSIGPIFANRGLSGIDGNISTCAGIAQTMPLIAVLGDLATFHDLNGLAEIKKTRFPIKLIVINNGGGGIFSFVSVPSNPQIAETFFATAHEYEFEKAAALFDIPYAKVEKSEDLSSFLTKPQTQLIEIQTNRAENAALHKELDQLLCLSSCTVS